MTTQTLDRISNTARTHSGRSKLFRWMKANRAEFAALVEETRPNWKALAEAFAAEGMGLPNGKPLKPESVRHTWYRARLAAEKKKPIPVQVRPVIAERIVAPVSSIAGDPLAAIKQQLNARSGRPDNA
jgi:hypothetical protein